MKIAVYCAKGSAGKTPIATNIVLDRDYALGTNEPFHVFEGFIPEERLLALKAEEEFPELPPDIDIVFDLAGSMSQHAYSIVSAIRQSDLVIVPVFNEVKALHAALGTIGEVSGFTDQIMVVATKLEKERREKLPEGDWKQSAAYRNIKAKVDGLGMGQIPVLPLKFSKVFDLIFEKEQSIRQLMAGDALAAYNFKEVAKQFDAIYEQIDKMVTQSRGRKIWSVKPATYPIANQARIRPSCKRRSGGVAQSNRTSRSEPLK